MPRAIASTSDSAADHADTGIFTGWRDEHGLGGVRLRPAVLPEDAERVICDVVPLVAGSPPRGNILS
ncbi:Uncharacterised protein [Amycolatopsis camponoti]|uniref:Uncharacterized protein n=1 Tax=Amycolatopsis camponoti TaxID=2606593 RepID=A0A6I8LNC6_9PSEU|nr:hypothetical protein [Amycolatopsis camponoti]VVJ18383.1 Uncharacterised protein [Amycolatopsis camponoti]